jgi:hypothetical protein
MKKLILLSCLLSFSSFAAGGKSNEVIAAYQELCAKEQDPVKRHNYCYMLENSGRSHTKSNIFRQDIAVV